MSALPSLTARVGGKVPGIVGAFAAAVSLLWSAQNSSASRPSVTVVTSSAVPAYREALEGLRDTLAGSGLNVAVVDPTDSQLVRRMSTPPEQNLGVLVIAIGTDAAKAVAEQRAATPYVATMVLGAEFGEGPPTPQRVGAVTLDVTVEAVVRELRRLFPGKTRLGIMRDPKNVKGSAADIAARAKSLGFEVWVVDCFEPGEVVNKFLSFRGNADFVWCMPDRSLYHAATIKPLIMASLRSNLPIVGFSAAFVRAGAAMGVYPDFRDIGQQTGELAIKYLAEKHATGSQGPRRLAVSVNRRVLRLIGLEQAPGSEDSVVTIQ